MAVAALCFGHLHITHNTLCVPQNNSHAKFESKQGALWVAVFLGCRETFRDIPKNGCKGDYGQRESGVELFEGNIVLYWYYCIHHSFPFLYV